MIIIVHGGGGAGMFLPLVCDFMSDPSRLNIFMLA